MTHNPADTPIDLRPYLSPMPPYDVLYIDPPWQYDNVKTGGSHTSGSAQQYPVLSAAFLKTLPVADIAARDSVCFLWGTTPFGKVPYEVLDAWGFHFKTEWYWHKTGRKGTGYWTRGCVEKLLVGIRGDVKAWRANVDNWFEVEPVEATPVGHSRKPERFIRLIEELTPTARSRVELFATEHSAALAAKSPLPIPWDCFGLELGHDFRDRDFWGDGLDPEPVLTPSLGDA